jgi:DNA polymerase-3 subunit beta
VGQLPKDGKVNLELNEKTLSLSLTCQGYTATMKGMDPANFPLILQFADPTEDDPAISFTMNVGQLDAVIQDTVSAASTDDSRPMLTGVEFKSDGKTFTVAATDGYQLAKWQTDCELGTFSFIVPASGLKKIGAAMGLIGEDDDITVLYFAKKEKLFFQAEGQYSALDIELATIPGRFPDYNGIIPKSSDTIVTIDKDDLDAALKLAWPFAKENNKIVRFDIDGDKMTISARSMEAGDSIAVVPITSEGKAVGIALNMAYVKAAIAGMDGNVEIGLTTELRPATLQNGTDVLRVIMPMHPQR